jgi:hypothetical protein
MSTSSSASATESGRSAGDDYLREFVERYDGHVSDYVARKRRERGLGC